MKHGEWESGMTYKNTKEIQEMLQNKPVDILKYIGVGRNHPCPCGSGKKFKKCCIDKIRG